MRPLWPRMLLLAVLTASCATPRVSNEGDRQDLVVFAAASLTDALTEIGTQFETTNPSVHVNFSFGGSQTLRTQIEAGAPADVFASANEAEMQALAAVQLVKPGSARIFATNQLVVVLPEANEAGIRNLQDLGRAGFKLVLAAEDVPVGRYTRESLERMNDPFGSEFSRSVLANVVSYEDNVRQVVAKIQLGEADAGIVYVTDAAATRGVTTIQIPPDLNVVARYPIAILKRSTREHIAEQFVDYVLSPDGQAVLAKWGFGPQQEGGV